MRLLVWILALFSAAVGITLAAKYNSGYVLVVAPPYRMELSLNFFILLFVLLFSFLYGLARLASSTLSLPEKSREFHKRRALEKARSLMLDGLTAFFEGRYAKAEKAALGALELNESPAINAVVAARSAHELREFDKRDQYLRQAESVAPDDKTLRLVTQAELYLDERRFNDALTVLGRLKENKTRQHTAALRLELRAQQQLQNWDAVLDLAEQLELRHAFDAALSEQLRRNARRERLKQKAHEGKNAFFEYWQRMPEAEKTDPKVAYVAAQSFASFKQFKLAQQAIESGLEKNWDSDLVSIYADCPEPDALTRIEFCEKYLSSHDDDSVLLLVLGKLCLQQKLWGKAKNYLDASLSVKKSVAAHLASARLAEAMQKPEDAQRHYRLAQEMILSE